MLRNVLLILSSAASLLSIGCAADPVLGVNTSFYQGPALKVLDFSNGLNKSDIYKIDAANLMYKTSDGGYQAVNDLYVTAYYSNGAPLIIDHIEDGIAPEFSSLDLDGNGTLEILLHYHSGAHTSGYRIYEITYDGITEIKSIDCSELVSSLDSIQISLDSKTHKYQFVVKDMSDLPNPASSESKPKFVTKILVFENGKLVTLSTKSE